MVRKEIGLLIETAEELGFQVCLFTEDEDVRVEFSKRSSCGRDFSFEIIVEEDDNMIDIWRSLQSYCDDFDVSAEAYLWLDETGHGKNGAPFEMIDVYKDMEECKKFVCELADKVFDDEHRRNN